MEDLIFHMFFVVPLTKWVTSPDRFWNKHSVVWGVVLAVFCLFIVGILQSARDAPNHFETLGTVPNAPRRVVSSTYRRLSLAYHPDKNPSMEAKETFSKIREAHEVLSSERRRDAYCRFGDYSIEGDVDGEQFYDVMLFAVFQFLVPFLFGFLYTYGDESSTSRKLFSTYLAFTFSLEILLRFDVSAYEFLSFLPVIGNYLPFEKIKLFQSWIPIILNSLLLLGTDVTESEEDVIGEVSKHVLISNMECIKHMDAYMKACEDTIQRGAEKGCSVTLPLPGVPGSTEAHVKIVACDALIEKKPWRLENNLPTIKDKDVWHDIMIREAVTWPRDLSIKQLVSRSDCQEENWQKHAKEIDALVKELDDDNGSMGISLGSVIFFVMLLIRAISGG